MFTFEDLRKAYQDFESSDKTEESKRNVKKISNLLKEINEALGSVDN